MNIDPWYIHVTAIALSSGCHEQSANDTLAVQAKPNSTLVDSADG